jgi:hypothetical protein
MTSPRCNKPDKATTMKRNIKHLGGLLAASVLLPGLSSATVLLDTGAPTGTTASVVNATSWVAAEFSATAGDVVQSLGAYLTQGAGSVGDSFTFDIYSNSNFINGRSTSRQLLDAVTATFTTNGWNLASTSWVVPTTSSYWLAVQIDNSSVSQSAGLSMPNEASATTGSVPASGFAYLGPNTGQKFVSAGALPVGLEVSTSPVPLPAAVWLFGSGLAGLTAVARRRRTAA